jgi:hypothetical protein
MSEYSMTDFDGRNGRSLNLEGFKNFQKPIPILAIEKAVAEGNIIAISPEGLSKLNQDINKAVSDDFEGIDKFKSTAEEMSKFVAVLVDHTNQFLH